VGAGQLGQLGRRTRQQLVDQVQGPGADQHRPRVEDVLAGGPAVDVLGVLGADHAGQRRDQGDHGVGGLPGGERELTGVEVLGHGRLRDRGSGLLRQGSKPRLDASERGLGVQHGLQPRGVVDHGLD
jgi:hypothetical protein